MLMGHLNHARFLLRGPNFGAGRPFLLKNDHLRVLGLAARRHACTRLFIINSRFRVKVGSFFDQAPRPGCQKFHFQKLIFPKFCYWGSSNMLMGHLNHARFLLGSPNFGAGRHFLLT
jgi:hypothetical protein